MNDFLKNILHFAGKMFYLRGPRLLVATVLILVKCAVLPIVTKSLYMAMNPSDLSGACNFLFIYSTFPTAPGVLAFALQCVKCLP